MILLVKVAYWIYGPWEGHRRVEHVQDLAGLEDVWFFHLICGFCEDDQGWKGNHF